MRSLQNIISLATALIMISLVSIAQENRITGDIQQMLEQKIPADPDVRIGKLENGLAYYIRKNSKPEDKIEFLLAVRAGSTQEDEDQRGLAHFIEHMAFNGSKNFKKNELVDYLQSIGVEFGYDLNAYTSFGETVYMLPIPTGDDAIMEKGFQVLEDWAAGIAFDAEEIEKERGVILEELRTRRNASQRMLNKWLPIAYKDTRYAERLPIGKKKVIETANRETFKKFYDNWYRPNLMAIVAVGDLELDEMETQIKERFSSLENPDNELTREEYEVPGHEETRIAIVQDKEAAFTQVQLIYKQSVEEKMETLSDMRRQMTYNLYNTMLNARLSELRESANPPFLFGFTSYGRASFGNGQEYSSFASVSEDGVENGLKTLLVENERVKAFGFGAGELERAKKQLLNRYDRQAKEVDKTESRPYAMRYVRSFTSETTPSSAKFNYDLATKLLGGIGLDEINQYASKWIKDTDRVVIITGPEKEGLEPIKEERVRELLVEVTREKIEPYKDELAGSSFFTKKVTKGAINEEKNIDNVGVVQLKLSNGATVVLKQTDFKNDEILMSARSDGGHSLYGDDVFESASSASAIVAQSGVSDFSSTDLRKLFAGKTVRVSPFIGTYSEGLNGSSSPKDLETMMQMIHLYFTSPRKDEEAFESYKKQTLGFFQNIFSSPQNYFRLETSKVMSKNHPRASSFPTQEMMDKIDLDKAYEIFQERFADAGNFTFVFVGNFDLDKIKPLLETYIASLPSIERSENWKDLGIRPPKGDLEKVIYKGTDPKSQINIMYRGGLKSYDVNENYRLSSLGEILSNRLIDLIREEKSGAYSISTRGSISRTPYVNYNFSINFPTGPEKVDELMAAIYDEIDRIKKEGITQEDLDKIKEAQRIDRKENLKNNRTWLNSLRTYYQYDIDLGEFYDYEKRVEALTTKDIQQTAKKYLTDKNRYQFLLMPEEGE
mgnify:CR=1 FL=1